jgi:hypothetical protein
MKKEDAHKGQGNIHYYDIKTGGLSLEKPKGHDEVIKLSTGEYRDLLHSMSKGNVITISDGKIAMKKFQTDVAPVKADKILKMQNATENFINQRYPQLVQNTLNAILVAKPSKKTMVENISVWIKDVVSYLYDEIGIIENMSTSEEVAGHVFYLKHFEKTDPKIKVRDLLG